MDAPLGGRYDILALVGTGGMGNVYRARDRELDEVVALKMLRPEILGEPGALERFRREVKLARRITHRNVARTFDLGEQGPLRFITMEFVEGDSLAVHLARTGPLAVDQLIDIALDMCAGLGAAHAAGVIHCDLKPANVILDCRRAVGLADCRRAVGLAARDAREARDARAVLTDFGVSWAADQLLQGAPQVFGTPGYMAPEVSERSPIDGRTDLFALGAMMFEMAAGLLPGRDGDTEARWALDATDEAPDPRLLRADLPPPLAHAIRRCLARDPADRFPDAGALAAALRACIPDQPSSLPRPPSPARPVTARTRPEKTVAVLPFHNAGAPDDDYLADGLTDDLIDTLSMTRGLRVRSRSSVMRYRDARAEPQGVGRELSVQAVVEGTLRRVEGGLRISARVLSVLDGFQLWARRFDRPAAEVLVVGDEVARAVAAALTVEVNAPEWLPPTDPVALDLYLRARHEYHRFRPEEVERAVALFEQALERAPDAPEILAGWAMARMRLWFHGRPSEALARGAAERAVAAAPERGEPHVALATVRFHAGDLAGALAETRTALGAAPRFAEAHLLLGRILVEAGRIDEGIESLRTAAVLEPDLLQTRWELLRAHALLGEWAKTEVLLALPPDTDADARPLWINRFRMAMWRRDGAALDAVMQDPVASSPVPLVRGLRRIIATRGAAGAAAADEALDPSLPSPRWRSFVLQLMAEGAAYFGERARAVEAIEGALAAGLSDLAWLDRCPLFEGLRADPRFAAAREKVAAHVAPLLAALG